MAHTMTFTVVVTVERESGKFATVDELREQIAEALEGADPGSVSGVGADGTSEYVVSWWDVGSVLT